MLEKKMIDMQPHTPEYEEGIWPGFVDALSALLTVVLFAFMIFVVSYVYLANVVRTKETSMSALTQEIKKLRQENENERKNTKISLDKWEKIHALYLNLNAVLAKKEKDIAHLHLNQANQDKLSEKERTAIHQEKLWLEERIAQLEAALKAKNDEASSIFFGKLRKALEKRRDIRVVGDRFVFQSEILFHIGSADINQKGKKELEAIAQALKDVIQTIPKDVTWILRVDGHTDDLPVRKGAPFASNLALSTARSLSVITFLIQKGVPAFRLAAAGFGEFRPLHPGAHSPKDRRIELMIDQGY